MVLAGGIGYPGDCGQSWRVLNIPGDYGDFAPKDYRHS